jgi:hypothetical protein
VRRVPRQLTAERRMAVFVESQMIGVEEELDHP